MLRLFVLATMQVIFFQASAATESTSSFNIAQFVRETINRSSFNSKNFGVALGFSDFSATSGASNSLGVGIRYAQLPLSSVGYVLGATLESIDSHLYTLTFDPSISFGINGMGYLLGGFSYSLPLVETIANSESSGDFGYHAGAGLQVTPRWNIEALYRQLNFQNERSTNPKDPDYLRYSGLLLRATYALN